MKWNKKYVYITLGVLICVAIVLTIVRHFDNDKEDVESVVEETEQGFFGNIVSSFADEEETEVKTDAQLKYDVSSIQAPTYEEGAIPEYLRKIQETELAEYEETKKDIDYERNPALYPGKYKTYDILSAPEVDLDNPPMSLADCDWYYISIGDVVTVDGIKCDMIPTGYYLSDDKISGAKTLGNSIPTADLTKPLNGQLMGGYSIPVGTYKVLTGSATSMVSYTGLMANGDKVVPVFLASVAGCREMDESTHEIVIDEGVMYSFSECALQKVGE